MSAAVAARQGGTAHNGNSNSNSRMGTGSPVDTKRNVKGEGMFIVWTQSLSLLALKLSSSYGHHIVL
jgi:hypothetical protein